MPFYVKLNMLEVDTDSLLEDSGKSSEGFLKCFKSGRLQHQALLLFRCTQPRASLQAPKSPRHLQLEATGHTTRLLQNKSKPRGLQPDFSFSCIFES